MYPIGVLSGILSEDNLPRQRFLLDYQYFLNISTHIQIQLYKQSTQFRQPSQSKVFERLTIYSHVFYHYIDSDVQWVIFYVNNYYFVCTTFPLTNNFFIKDFEAVLEQPFSEALLRHFFFYFSRSSSSFPPFPFGGFCHMQES